MSTTHNPTVREVLADAQKAGYVVRRMHTTVNGRPSYSIEGRMGLFTIEGIMTLLGIYG